MCNGLVPSDANPIISKNIVGAIPANLNSRYSSLGEMLLVSVLLEKVYATDLIIFLNFIFKDYVVAMVIATQRAS